MFSLYHHLEVVLPDDVCLLHILHTTSQFLFYLAFEAFFFANSWGCVFSSVSSISYIYTLCCSGLWYRHFIEHCWIWILHHLSAEKSLQMRRSKFCKQVNLCIIYLFAWWMCGRSYLLTCLLVCLQVSFPKLFYRIWWNSVVGTWLTPVIRKLSASMLLED